MNSLERKHHKYDGANKYHIDCKALEKNHNIIPIIFEKVIKNKNDVTVLESILKNNTSITEVNKNIVVKIGKVNKTIEKEYMIGKILEKNKLHGFINYICLFSCYDNTYENIESKINQALCSEKNEEDNLKTVLIMPYIQEGSIRRFKWNVDKYDALKSILMQTIMSVFIAYQVCGFLHNDMHLDNILIKKTKKESIEYNYFLEDDKKSNISIKTHGYKIVIMDFENAMLVVKNRDSVSTYWNNILNMISRLHYDLKNKDGDRVAIIDLTNITSFIEKQENSKGSVMNTIKLLDMVRNIKLVSREQIKSKLVYDPNIFL